MTDRTTLGRIPLIDVLRGVALLAMTVYHFTWDLEFFGYLVPGTINEPGWVGFARAIAASFLALAGVSLVLAHGNGIRWHGFWKREAMVVVAALAITAVTYFAFPESYIFFGILHAIALFSLLGLAFLRLPWWAIAAFALLVFAADHMLTMPAFSHWSLLWVGLSPQPPLSNDYVPLFPWFSATLAGMAFAKLAQKLGWWATLASISVPSPADRPLRFMGRHSLAYYLIHQPVLLGLLWSFQAVSGPPDRTSAFTVICKKQCSITESAEFCEGYCGCIAEELKKVGLLNNFFTGQLSTTDGLLVDGVKAQCVAKMGR
ncbi:MAG: heparan-alpha-glucosaminide N-acetyltransferase [Pseudomonadota bacterium]